MATVQTTITNASGATRKFTWFPPHGVELAAAGTKTILGILEDKLAHERDRAAFLADVAAGNITVAHTGLS